MGAGATRPARAAGRLFQARPRRPGSSGDGQETGHDGAATLGAVDLDGASVLFEDLMADGQAESEAVLLGREEWVEDPAAQRRRDSPTIVHHLRLDHRALSGAEVDLAEQRVAAH